MKGFWRTVESVTAAIILVSFLLTAGSMYFVKDDVDMSSVGYKILEELDNRGELRPYAETGDYASLSSKISVPGYNHSVKICDHTGNCTGVYPDVYKVYVSTYIISGNDEYEPYEMRLYVWG